MIGFANNTFVIDYTHSVLFNFMLILIRVSSCLMVMPTIGEGYISPRIRIVVAFLLSCLLTNSLTQHFIEPIDNFLHTSTIIFVEICTGVFIGSFIKMLLSILQTTGVIISMQSGLSTAMLFDPNQGGQNSSEGNLLYMMALLLVLSLNIHHEMIMALVSSYKIFPIGQFLFIEDKVQHYITTFAAMFKIAVQLSSAHLVVGLVLYTGAGILSRLMPSMHIFFIMLPIQIFVGVFLMTVFVLSGMTWYIDKIIYFIEQFV